jgi:hypothetical protein
MRSKWLLGAFVVIAALSGVAWHFALLKPTTQPLPTTTSEVSPAPIPKGTTSDASQVTYPPVIATQMQDGRIALGADTTRAKADSTPTTVDVRRSVMGNLAGAYQYGMTSTERGSGTLALYSIATCLNFRGAKEPFLPPLPPPYKELLSKASNGNVDEIRKASASKLKQLCAGFDQANYSNYAAAAYKKSEAEGFGFLKYRVASEPTASYASYEAALKTLLEWPERYDHVLSVNTSWLESALVGRFEGRLTSTEAMFASQLVLCGLGADCSPNSVPSLEYCAMTGSCNGTLIERVVAAASASGLDTEKLRQLSLEFISDFKRGDRSKLRL